jgi:CheY-like chemotaxis protein
MPSLNALPVKSLKTALIVDDDAFSQALAHRVLSSLGFTECAVAQDGEEGLRCLSQMADLPTVILCDIFMPNKDGIEFLVALGKRGFPGQVVLVSGGDPVMLDLAETLGNHGGLHVVATLSKPLDRQQLAQVLGITLGA